MLVRTSTADAIATYYHSLLFVSPLSHHIPQLGLNETVPGRQRSALVAGLQPSAVYLLRVFAVNRHGSSRPSAALRVHTEPEPPGGPPLNVRLQPLGPRSLRLTWNVRHTLSQMSPIMMFLECVQALLADII